MTSTSTPIVCPWCAHETTDRNTFRTHLMVEHRKSELATYVLETERARATDESVETDTTAGEDDAEEPSEREREIVAR